MNDDQPAYEPDDGQLTEEQIQQISVCVFQKEFGNDFLTHADIYRVNSSF